MTTDELWHRLCLAVDAPEWLQDPRLDTVPGRGAAMAELVLPRLEQWAADLPADAAAARLAAAGLPAGVVQTLAELRRCPHLAARELFTVVRQGDDQDGQDGEGLDSPDGEGPALVGAPLLFDAVRPRVGQVPRLGEHTTAVLDPLRDALSR